MNMNPWMVEQLVAGRMEELRRTARARVPGETPVDRQVAPPALRSRPAVARHLGALLIAVGRRLADTDSFPAAFEGPHPFLRHRS